MDQGFKNPLQQPRCPLGFWALLLYSAMMTAGLVLAIPIWVPWVITSAKRRRTIRQRLGWWTYPWESERHSESSAPLWVHALSVGEVSAAQPFVEKVREQYPSMGIVVSVSTLTGFQTASRLFKGQDIDLAFFPYDWLWSVQSVVKKINPKAVVLVETDIWPVFLSVMHRMHIPVYIVNLRISDSAWKRYRQLKRVAAALFGAFEAVFLQTPRDARRLIKLGVDENRLHITGNFKFDRFSLDSDQGRVKHWRNRLHLDASQPVIVAGSTHHGEEPYVLDAFKAIQDQDRAGAARLIVAPRDHNRATEVLALCRQRGLAAVRLSHLPRGIGEPPPEVIVVDSIGVLKELFSLADVAFVGGSLVNEGGHNPLEPAIHGKPILFGPDMRDFRQIAAWLLEAGGARQVGDAKALSEALSHLLDDRSEAMQMGERAKAVVVSHQGAVSRTLAYLLRA